MPDIHIHGLSKQFGATHVLKGLDLTVRDGEFLTLLGSSGCGKSTLLRLIAGLDQPDAGTLHLGERDLLPLSPGERDCAMVFQSYALYPHMTVYENMAFGLKLRKLPRPEIDRRVREASALLGLDAYLDRRPKALSGGQRQRLAIARAILRNPPVLILDGATSALDYESERLIQEALDRLAEGRTVITIAHRLSTIRNADQIYVMAEGTVAERGTHDELVKKDGLYASLVRLQATS